jgi:uncharacterized SAM-binding protein YcdF (DUF218 family)
MLVIKKAIGMLTSPGTLILVLLGYGCLRLVFSRGPGKKGLAWVGLGVACLYFFTTGPLPNFLMGRLEKGQQPVTTPENLSKLKYIVVLSAGLRATEGKPPTSRLDEASALRVAEGVRLFRLLAGAPILIMTGEGPFGDIGSRMAALAQSLGVPADKLIPANTAKDTYGNAREVRDWVKKEPFLLVTSAAHMPRSLMIFQKLGMKPVPAPGDFRHLTEFFKSDYLPSSHHLFNMDAAIHEYLGLAYLYLFPQRAGR